MATLAEEKMNSLLEQILQELRRIRKATQAPVRDVTPYIPSRPEAPRMSEQCHRCGISLSGIMAYACPSADCPTGLGPTICGDV